MNDIKIFENNQFGEIRTLKKDEEIWFVAGDVANILDFRDAYTAARSVADEDKKLHKLRVAGQNREVTLINEAGLYTLALKSRKPEAKKFKKWITHEVIPEIRKTGQYISKPSSVEDLIIMQAESVKELKQKVDHQEEQIKSIKGAVIHTDQDWRNWVNQQLNKIGFKNNNYKGIRKQSYFILEKKACCRLNVRLNNLKERLEQAGSKKSKINNVSKLDVIEDDTRLKEIYTSIVEKLVIKYSA